MLRYRVQQTKFFVILGHFLLFYTTIDPKIKPNFEKVKKTTGDIIILHLRTPNDNHMMYGSWDIKSDSYFFSFWTIFCPFTPPRPLPRDIIILHKYTINDNHMIYGS